jgi:hypothetical protein
MHSLELHLQVEHESATPVSFFWRYWARNHARAQYLRLEGLHTAQRITRIWREWMAAGLHRRRRLPCQVAY